MRFGTLMTPVLFAALVVGWTACKGKSGNARISTKSVAKAAKLAAGKKLGEAMPQLEKILGKPTKRSAKEIHWAAVNGDECVSLSLSVKDGVLGVDEHGMVNAVIERLFKKCKAKTK